MDQFALRRGLAGLTVSPKYYHEGTKTTKHTKASALALLSHQVIGAAIEVHRLIGPGLLESIYELALCREFYLRGIEVQRQVNVPVLCKGKPLECGIKLDPLVQRSIVVEIKSVEKIVPVPVAQLLTYLRLRELWLGLIINFNVEVLRDGVRRVLNG